MDATRGQCAAHCTATPKCAGWVYRASGTVAWTGDACWLERFMCDAPVSVPEFIDTAYYKTTSTPNPGKSMNVPLHG